MGPPLSAHMHINQNATLSFKFEIFNSAHASLVHEKLPIYLDAISNFPLQVLDSIFKKGPVLHLNMGKRL